MSKSLSPYVKVHCLSTLYILYIFSARISRPYPSELKNSHNPVTGMNRLSLSMHYDKCLCRMTKKPIFSKRS